jgi:hypothetical protein
MREIRSPLTGFSLFVRPPVPVAPPYEEPVDDDPILPPQDEQEEPIDPTPPDDTPIDPETDEPEPGFPDDYVAPERIDIEETGPGNSGNRQTVIRTEADPGTWANAYIATPVAGGEYCEIEIHNSTPAGATLAVGISTLDMPLNGIPGNLPGTIAWWSDGTVRQDGQVIGNLPTWGRRDRLSLMLNRALEMLGAKGCAFNAETFGDLSDAPRTLYVFVGMYSTGSRARFHFSTANFACERPAGFYPIGQVPPPLDAPDNLQAEVILDA